MRPVVRLDFGVSELAGRNEKGREVVEEEDVRG